MANLNVTPIGRFSSIGAAKMHEMTTNSVVYVDFLKFYGRVFKHPISVALEFFAQNPRARFIGSEAQWNHAGFHLIQGSEGIKFLDKNGAVVSLYDFSQIREDAPPPVWMVTSQNVKQIKAALQISEDTSMISGLVNQSVTATRIANCMAELHIPYDQADIFRQTYVNAVQLMIAGRLEIGGNSFKIRPNLGAFQTLKTDEQRFALLAHAAASAREALSSIEFVIQNLPPTRSTERKDEYDLRSMAESEQRGAINGSGQQFAGSADTSAAEQHSTVKSSSTGWNSGMGIDSEGQERGRNRLVSGGQIQSDHSRRSDNDDLGKIQSDERTVRAADLGSGSIHGTRTDWNLRDSVDGIHGGASSDQGGVDAVQSQLPDRSSFGGQGSERVSADVGKTVRSNESKTPDFVRSDSQLGTRDGSLHEQTGHGGKGSGPYHDSITAVSNTADLAEKATPSTELAGGVADSDGPHVGREEINIPFSAKFSDGVDDEFDPFAYKAVSRKTFAEQVDAVLNGTADPYSSPNVDTYINRSEEMKAVSLSTERRRKTRPENLYELFAQRFPEIVSGQHSHERYGYLDSPNGAEPLSVEHLGGNCYSYMLYYVQNGDLMRDPDFTFVLDHENKTLHVMEYQMDGVPPVGTVYQSVMNENGAIDQKLQASLESLFMSTLQHQNDFDRPLTRYSDETGDHILSDTLDIPELSTNEEDEPEEHLPEIRYAENPTSRIVANIRALRELKRLEDCKRIGKPLYTEGRNSYNSKEESDKRLRGYSGWGGLTRTFDSEQYRRYRDQIQELLTPDEYASVKASTLNSYYTSAEIIDAMYQAVQQMGLSRDSRILEPSCGTGNFISRMPHGIGHGGVVGIELDSITAQIASYLASDRENVRIVNGGFETTELENGSFDLAIGNVPFGDHKMNDPDYVNDWLIHDAFFRRALDKIAVGGVVAFITSSGTLDKKNPKIREYLATQADLIGAIRLPNTAFDETSVTTDIIFLQKRAVPLQAADAKPDWCYTIPNADGLRINSYFVQNPRMILGTMKQTTHFNMLTCDPIEGVALKKQLSDAIRNLSAKIVVQRREKAAKERIGRLEPWGKDFAYHVSNDKVYYRKGNEMLEIKGSNQRIEMYKAHCCLRDLTRELLDKQKTHISDEALQPLRIALNEQYDSFVKQYATLNDKSVRSAFMADSDYAILSALESIDKDGNVSKADIFTTRTVNPAQEITSVLTVEESLQVSLDQKGNVNIPYMAMLMQEMYPQSTLSEVRETITQDLLAKGLIFRDPERLISGIPYAEIVERTEYLSGNVRRKLAMAQEAAKQDDIFQRNVKALQAVIPEDIKAAEIDASMGCAWIEAEDYAAFLHELSGRDRRNAKNVDVSYSRVTGEFSIMNARSKRDLNVHETATFGTADMNMYEIAEKLLNQRRIVVMRSVPSPNDSSKTVMRTDAKATKLAMEKAALIRAEFKKWIFATSDRRRKYERIYNQLFNSLVGRSYDGSGLTFNGITNGFELRTHQRDCVARTIYGGNTLVAHVVGAGKSAVIATSVMKKKELGLISKACVVVPKPLTEQAARDWRKVYPDARLLVVTAADLADEKKREVFSARVATGNYDAVIMSQEQFEKMRMSTEYQTAYIQRQLDQLEDMLLAHRNQHGNTRDTTTRAIESAKKKLETRLKKIMNPKSKQKGKDTLLDFENLGFDYLVVDEAHAYKNGFVATKMSNVAGVTTTPSGRADDMQMKCDYINTTLGNGHILFCTGTPVSNSMTELYVMTRYLRPDLLVQTGTERFDDWAATFGNITTKNKQTAAGTLKLKTSFSSFKNLPELMTMYKEFADIKTASQLELPRPALKTGKAQIITVDASPEQRAYVRELAERAYRISTGAVDPREDNLLKITSEARLIGLGNQAVAALYSKRDEELPTGFTIEKDSKVDACIQNVVKIYAEQAETKGVQIVFSDIAVNGENGNFSVYEYLKQELIEQGIPESEIVFAPKSDAKNREEVFRAINEGQYRVVIASTGTLGTGANIQERLYALHHLDVPWKPSDFEQREGRILRQGNSNPEVEIFNYVTQGTLDSYLYQTVTDKARFIAQLWNDKCPARVMEDCDDKVLSYGELQAAAEGNPDLRVRLELQNEIGELRMLRSEYLHETAILQKQIEDNPERQKQIVRKIEQTKSDLSCAQAMKEPTSERIKELSIVTNDGHGDALTDRAAINQYLMQQISKRLDHPFEEMPSFRVGKFTVSVQIDSRSLISKEPVFVIKGDRDAAYYCSANSNQNSDNCQRLMNFFDSGIARELSDSQENLIKLQADLAQAEERVAMEFPNEARLAEAEQELLLLEERLTAGGYIGETDEIVDADEEPILADAKSDSDIDDLQPLNDDDDSNSNLPSIK